MVDCSLDEAFDKPHRVSQQFRPLDYPLWDLAGRVAAKPVYALLRQAEDRSTPYSVPCYDTSLYIDDLQIEDDAEAAALIAAEARDGFERGHRAFKIKVGRGAIHMPLESGTRRDVMVVRAVREAVGAECRLMIDANNGYNMNLTKRVLAETAEANIYWLEEPFHEDARLYAHLKEWMAPEGLATLIADGEGDASKHLLDWVRQGLIDIIQYDIYSWGFTPWLELASQLDPEGVRSAPHHYGEPYGNYAACHLAAGIAGFEAVEWDEAAIAGLDASAYAIVEGRVRVPDLPGFGLVLDDEVYSRAVEENGFSVESG